MSAITVSRLFYGENMPNIDEVQEILNWRRTNEFKSNRLSQLSRGSDLPPAMKASLQQIEDECLESQEDKCYFDVKGYVTYIRPDNMYYPACQTERCMKKVTENDQAGKR